MHPDPLEFLYRYRLARDREVAALVASCLAYGKVALILRSVESVLGEMGRSPHEFVTGSSDTALKKAFPGFKHRFTTGEELGGLMVGVKHALGEYGSLNACFTSGLRGTDETVLGALGAFSSALEGFSGRPCLFLLPHPARGSACKRLNLFLRWLVRKDEVDPGGWRGVSRSKLIVPLDTHMYRAGLALGFTSRRSPDLKASLEITSGFRGIVPADPVRYDFALTRLGIRDDASFESFLSGIDRAQC